MTDKFPTTITTATALTSHFRPWRMVEKARNHSFFEWSHLLQILMNFSELKGYNVRNRGIQIMKKLEGETVKSC